MAKKTKPRGRPALPKDQGKREAVALRTTSETKNWLTQTAEKSGRSLSQEIEFRLERSRLEDELFGPGDVRELCRTLALTIEGIERKTRKSWRSDLETFEAVQGAISIVALPFAKGEVWKALTNERELAKKREEWTKAFGEIGHRYGLLGDLAGQELPEHLRKLGDEIADLQGRYERHAVAKLKANKAAESVTDGVFAGSGFNID